MLAADRPEEPEHGEQLDERAAVAVGERVAQLVGEVDLLGGDRVDRRELVAAGEAGAVAVRVRGRPGPPGRARLAGLAGALELQAAELADGLEHPVADAARRVADAEQRLVDEPLDRIQRAVAEHRVRGLEREPVVEEGEPAQRAPLGVVDQVPRPVDHGEQRLVAVGRATVAAAQQREAVLEPPVDLLDRHRPDLRRGQLDRQRETVEPGHDAPHEILGQLGSRARREGAVAEQRGGVGRPELAEQVDVLRGDLERRAARREHTQVGGRRDEEGHQLGHRPDDVLAVVEHDEARPLRQPLRDAAAEVEALLRRQRPLRADRVAHVEHGAHLADDVVGRGDADELDDVHHRLGGVAREHVGEARLAETARPDDRDHARVGQQRAEPGDVAVAAAQRARVVAHAAADGAVEGQEVAVRPAEALAGIGAEPLEQVLPVGLVALERRPGPAHHGLAPQQVGEQRLVVGARGMGGLQRRQRLGMRAGAAGRLRQDHAGGGEIAGRRAADLGQRIGLVLARCGQPVRQRQRLAGQRGRAVGVVVERGGGVAHERGEPDAVDLGRVDPEPVADGVAHDRPGAERGPRARDQHLQALRRVRRRLLAPDQVDQPLGAHRPPAGRRQRRQQRLRTLPRDRGSPPAHVPQQGQGDGHGASLGSAEPALGQHRRELADEPDLVEVGVQELLAHDPREARVAQRAEPLGNLVDRAGDPRRPGRGEEGVGVVAVAAVLDQEARAVAQLGRGRARPARRS